MKYRHFTGIFWQKLNFIGASRPPVEIHRHFTRMFRPFLPENWNRHRPARMPESHRMPVGAGARSDCGPHGHDPGTSTADRGHNSGTATADCGNNSGTANAAHGNNSEPEFRGCGKNSVWKQELKILLLLEAQVGGLPLHYHQTWQKALRGHPAPNRVFLTYFCAGSAGAQPSIFWKYFGQPAGAGSRHPRSRSRVYFENSAGWKFLAGYFGNRQKRRLSRRQTGYYIHQQRRK